MEAEPAESGGGDHGDGISEPATRTKTMASCLSCSRRRSPASPLELLIRPGDGSMHTNCKQPSSSILKWKTRVVVHTAFRALVVLWLLLGFYKVQHERRLSYLFGDDQEAPIRSVVLRGQLSRPLNLIQAIIPRHFSPSSRPPSSSSATSESELNSSSISIGDRQSKIACDLSHFRTDVCELSGDVRIKGSRVALVSNNFSAPSSRVVAKVKPYTRKWEKSCMETIGEVSVEASPDDGNLPCRVNHSVPAVVFSTGGYTGNIYHEFNDGLIPLFITAQKFHGQVVFMILELHDWWMMKYGSIVERLSKYPVIDFDKNGMVHCFPQVKVGLEIHNELEINSTLMKDGKSMKDFQDLLAAAYSSVPLVQAPLTLQQPVKAPSLVLLARKGNRVLLNQAAVLRQATRLGFEVRTLSPGPRTELSEVYHVLQSADVLVGVHGAALTHLLFMRPGTVFIQIVPLGTDWPAYTYYGEPAVKAGLDYIEYKILPDESSLVKKYGRNHTAVTHPEKVAEQGWWEMKKIYLQDQDVKLSLSRFKPVLQDALKRLRKRQGRVHISAQ